MYTLNETMELFDIHLFTLVKDEQFSFAREVGLVIGVRAHRTAKNFHFRSIKSYRYSAIPYSAFYRFPLFPKW